MTLLSLSFLNHLDLTYTMVFIPRFMSQNQMWDGFTVTFIFTSQGSTLNKLTLPWHHLYLSTKCVFLKC